MLKFIKFPVKNLFYSPGILFLRSEKGNVLKFKLLMKLFYAGIRIFVGLQLMFAGYNETFALNAFSSHFISTAEGMEISGNSIIETLLICLPFIKFGLGLFILLGFFTKQSLLAGLLLFGLFTFVMMMGGNSSEVMYGLYYLTFFTGLMMYVENNDISLDNKANLTCRRSL